MKRNSARTPFLFLTLLIMFTIGSTCSAAAKPKLNITSKAVYVKQTCQLKLLNAGSAVTWTSSKKTVAKVSSKGLVTALKKGSSTITAKYAGKKYTCKITVKDPFISTKTASLLPGQSLQLKLTGATASKYVSSKKSVASVSSKGLVKALKAGKTVITVTDSKKRTYKCTVTVIEPKAVLSEKSVTISGTKVRYWLYTPRYPKDNLPLIVYLHGGSGKGDDLKKMIQDEGFPKYLYDAKLDIPAYVIMPQASADVNAWQDLEDEVISLVKTTAETLKVDKKNISLTGHSMGGIGTWTIGCNHQDLFARIAPLSGNVSRRISRDPENVRFPVWSFVGTGTSDSNAYNGNTAFFPDLKKYNSNAVLTILEGAAHKDVVKAYLNYDITGWLTGTAK